jgi:antitoxin (DNA-binding transcriptional repressor) of toxin-antitoxin stability system
MTTVTLEEAKAKLEELVNNLGVGDAIVIVRGTQPVAQLVPPPVASRKRKFGTLRGKLEVVAEDDEHLEGFEDYVS